MQEGLGTQRDSGGYPGWRLWAALIWVVTADLAVSTSPLDAFPSLGLVSKGQRKPLCSRGRGPAMGSALHTCS